MKKLAEKKRELLIKQYGDAHNEDEGNFYKGEWNSTINSLKQVNWYYYSQEIENYLLILLVIILLADVQDYNDEADHDQANHTCDNNQSKWAGWINEQFKSPIIDIAFRSEDDQLRVRDDGSPHSNRSLATNREGSSETFDVVVGSAHTEICVRCLQWEIGWWLS